MRAARHRPGIVESTGAFLDRHPTSTVFLVALVLRLGSLILLQHVPYARGGDAPHYLAIARDILTGTPYGVAVGDPMRVPLYPAFLALHLQVTGDWLIGVAITQAILDSMTAVLLSWTAAALLPGRRAWIAGLLWATYPPAIISTAVLFPQPLQVFFLMAAFCALVHGVRTGSVVTCGLAATLFGLSCLTREGNFLFLPIFTAAPLVCWRLRSGHGLRWAVTAFTLMLLCGAATVLSWTARDFPTTFRVQDLLSNAKERRAASLLLSPIQPYPDRFAAWLRTAVASPMGSAIPADGSSLSATEAQAARKRWRVEKGRLVRKLWQTFRAPSECVILGCSSPVGGTWAHVRAELGSRPLHILADVSETPCQALKAAMYVQHYLMLLLVGPGLVLLARRLPGVALLWGTFGMYTLITIVFGSNYSETLAAVPRFAFSLMPMVLLIVGLLLIERAQPAETVALHMASDRC